MAKKHGPMLGLDTQAERDQAFEFARKVFRDSRRRILENNDTEAFIFAIGYFAAIKDLATAEGAKNLAGLMDQLTMDLGRAYYGE